MRRLLALGVCLLGMAVPVHAQGCSECREQIGQTPVKTQQAYRRAIVLMVFAGGGIFAAGVVAIRRFR